MNDRKEAIRKYKERKITRGIFVIRSTATGRCWVDSSPNLYSPRNMNWSALRAGAHRNHDLQVEWNAHGESNFEFEIVETLDEDITEMAIRDELKSKRREWAKKLGAPTVSP
jgi:hypothetical protein